MLSEKLKEYLVETGLYDTTEDANYRKVMSDLEINFENTLCPVSSLYQCCNILW